MGKRSHASSEQGGDEETEQVQSVLSEEHESSEFRQPGFWEIRHSPFTSRSVQPNLRQRVRGENISPARVRL